MTVSSLTLSLLALTSLPNTPYPDRFTLVPALTLEIQKDWAYFEIENSARCIPDSGTRWNPITALWRVEWGVLFSEDRLVQFKLSFGHQSEHGVDRIWPATESRDYIRAEWKLK